MNKLKELRLQSEDNPTLDDVASATGINRATLSRYENSNTEPKMSALKKLANYYKVSVAELMGVDDYMKGFVDSMDSFNASFEHELEQQLDVVKSQVENNELSPQQQANLAKLIKLGILFKKYGSNDNFVTEISVILHALNNIINNTVDDDEDYQDTIDTFTKLVNNLKAQNKKATDD